MTSVGCGCWKKSCGWRRRQQFDCTMTWCGLRNDVRDTRTILIVSRTHLTSPRVDDFVYRISSTALRPRSVDFLSSRLFIYYLVVLGPQQYQFLDQETGPQWSQTFFLLLFSCLVLGLLLSDFQCTKAFSFHNRSSLNFAYRLKTLFSTLHSLGFSR